jgi:hypothetical protein
MVTRSEFVLDSVQAAIFTPDAAEFTSGRAVATILLAFPGKFNGDMQALPLPKGAPPELPHVVLQSRNERLRFQMAPARVDYIWSNEPSASPPPLSELIAQAVEVLDRYVREMPAVVRRLALVVSRVCQVDKPAEVLIERFCNEASRSGPFRRSAAFEIHNHKAYKPATGISYDVNSWVRCKTAALAPDNRPAIVVEQDLNTLAEEVQNRRFAPDDIRAFFVTAGREMDEILGLYFPEPNGR